jgi:tetratricopeptide (TPR) repeat protein
LAPDEDAGQQDQRASTTALEAYVRPVMIFFPSGDRETGLYELQHVQEHGRFIRTEAAYFLLQIYYVMENDFDQSIRYASWLRDEHPDNSFFHTFEGRVYSRWGNWNRAGEIFSEVLRRHEAEQTGYNDAVAEQALYYLGRTEMVYGDYRQALAHLDRLEQLGQRRSGDSFFVVLGRLRQGMAHDALGERDEAVRRYREVLSMRDWADVRTVARRYIEQPFRGIPQRAIR